MTRRYLLSPKARDDLSAIWDYSAEHWGRAQADRYVRAIVAACEAVAAGRRLGRSIDWVRPGYLRCAVGSHVLFYVHEEPRVIRIVRILHGTMDVERHL
jgi:toxin ParE1/3/4